MLKGFLERLDESVQYHLDVTTDPHITSQKLDIGGLGPAMIQRWVFEEGYTVTRSEGHMAEFEGEPYCRLVEVTLHSKRGTLLDRKSFYLEDPQ